MKSACTQKRAHIRNWARWCLFTCLGILLFAGGRQAIAETVGYAYIPNATSKTLSVINTSTGTLATTLTPSTWDATLNSYIYTAALRPGTSNEAWFGQYGSSNKLGVIDTTNNTLKTTISGTGRSTSITFSTDGATAYISDFSYGNLLVVNAATKAVTSTVASGCSGSFVGSAIKYDNSLLYVKCVSGMVRSYNTSTGTMTDVANTTLNGYGLAYDRTSGGRIYVSNNYRTGGIARVNLTDNSVTQIPVNNLGTAYPLSVAVRKNGSKIYVGDSSGTLHIIDAATTTTQSEISLGAQTVGVGVSANDAAVYVVLSNGTVKVVSTTTDAVTATIAGTSGGVLWGDFLGNVQAAAAPGTTPSLPPAATTGVASGITTTSAVLNASVNPNGSTTTVTFDYGTTTTYSSTKVAATTGASLAGSTDSPATLTLNNLTCGTTYHFRTNASSSAGAVSGSDATFATLACSADLSALVATGGTTPQSLTPTFLTATKSYAAAVANTVTSITVTPTAADASATIKVNGTAVTNGSASTPITLAVGLNTVTIVVTSRDSVATQTYTLAVTRAPADGSGTLTVSPASATASATNQTVTFTYTAATGGVSNGEIDINVSSLGTLGSVTTTSGTAAINSSGIIQVTGVTLASGATATITWSGATLASTAGVKTLSTTQKSSAIGTLTALAASPTVTLGMSPTATASAATGVGAVGATLNGTVNDNGTATTVTFDYGTTTAYGTNVAATFNGTIAAGAGGSTGKAVSVTLTGLSCGSTTYHYRVQAVNATGTTYSTPDQSFTTSACPLTVTTPVIATGANMATLTLQSSAAGTGYFTLLSGKSTTCGSSIQTKAGQGAYAAFRIGSLPLSANTPANYTIQNLTANTTYTVCFTAADSSGTLATAPATANLTTASASALTNQVWNTVGTVGFSAGSVYSTKLAFAPDGTPYVAYQDFANAGKTTVMKYNGSAWGTVGSAGFSAGLANELSLAFAPEGTPYVAYKDGANGDKMSVMKYNGTGWVNVGSAGFSAGHDRYPSLAFAPDGTPYVAFMDYTNRSRATVMKFNGTSWVTVGSAGFSPGPVNYTSLAFAPDGTPYVANVVFVKAGGTGSFGIYQASVMKFNGTSWVDVGSAGFPVGSVNATSLAFAPDGTPYVVYGYSSDTGYPPSRKATVMKYSYTSWVTVGSAGFSAGDTDDTSLSFAPDGTPYVSYTDHGNSDKATVMKYNGTSWVAMGSAGFSAGSVQFTSSAFAPDGTTYVAFIDGSAGSKATVMKLTTGYTVTYDGNGSSGGSVPTDSKSPYVAGATTTVLGNSGSLVKSGSFFSGWNTAADGSGTAQADGSTITIGTANVTLYAQWAAIPSVTNISPASGTIAGGTTVTITGTNLTGARGVKFGTTSAASFTVNSATQITASSPLGQVGAVDITVTTPIGISATSSADQFSYFAAPTVAGISTASGPTSGGTSVTITGTYLTGATAVKFGTKNATSFKVNSATQITAVAPTGAGTVDITVVTSGGTSATSSRDQFTFVAAPNVNYISPSSGQILGGDMVNINGTNLSSATSVKFGFANAKIISNTATQISVISPSSPFGAGYVDVTVTTPGGTSAKSFYTLYTYVSRPYISGISPASGPTTGGTSVTITGANLYPARAVIFGSNAASITSNSDSQIVAVSPAGAVGTVDITVISTGGTSVPSSDDQFTYLATYSVAYSGNGNSGGTAPTDSSSPYVSGATVTVPANSGTLTRNGYTFGGWNTSADGSGTNYTAGSGTFAISANTTLYAKWTALPTYTVTYNGNGNVGGNAPSDTSSPYITGSTVTVLGNTGTLVKPGYTFSGWNSAANGSGTAYAAAATFAVAANTTLYAQWTLIPTFTVTFNGNGSTGGTAPTDNSSPYTTGATVTVPGVGTLTRTGYTFSGWNSAANGSGTAYAAAATFTITANTTLYAQWTALPTYTVTYSGNSSTGGTVPSDSSSPYITGTTVTVLGNSGTLARTGYTFNGWNSAANGSGTAYAAAATFAIAANTTLYAQWTALPTYTVTYNGNSSTSGTAPTDGSSPYITGTTVTVLGNSGTLTRTGYTFGGWNTAADGSGTNYTAGSGTFAISANSNLYAKWTALPTYTVSYDGNGNAGGNAPTDGSSPYITGSTITVLGNTGTMVKPGYTFSGWNSAANGSGTAYAAAATFAVAANTTLYAQWTLIPTFTVTFNGNGSNGGTAPTDNSSPYNTGATVSVLGVGTLTRTGYTFSGWNSAANGSGTAYAAAATFAIAANTTLYAQWTALPTYTVTYSGNSSTGGTVPTDSSSPYITGTTVTVLGNSGTLTRAGYTFNGWNSAPDGSGTAYAAAATFAIAANTTLYAQWTALPTYTVTYNGNNNTGGTAPTDGSSPYITGTTVTVLSNSGTLTRTGYSFGGWNTAADGSGTNYTAGSGTFSISANTTLYAKWTASTTYSVTYDGNGSTGGTVPADSSSPYNSGSTVTVLGNSGTLTRTGYTFNGWNSAANGTGTAYAAAATFAINANTTLYAQWTSSTVQTVVANYSGNSLYVVDLVSGNRTTLSSSTVGTGVAFSSPVGIAREANGKILVGEGTGDVLRVDATSGNRTLLSSGMGNVYGLAVEANGNILAASYDQAAIYRIDPSTGNRTVVTSSSVGSGVTMGLPFGIIVDTDGSIVFPSYSTSELIRVNSSTGARTVISSATIGSGTALANPSSIVKMSDGTFAVLNNSGTAYVLRVDPATGNRTTISSSIIGTGPSFTDRYSMALDTSGNIYVADFSNNSIVKIDPTTGNRTTVSSATVGTGTGFSSPLGMLSGAVASITSASSTVSTLSSLSLSSGTLTPTFATGTTNYTASVANSVTSITVTPTVTDSNATVKVNGTTVTSGSASGSISLNVGSNTITVLVTAQDGTTTSSYTVTVTRAASAVSSLSALSLSSGTLTPTFASGTTAYTASVANSVTAITATPTVTNSSATVKVNGTTVTSGSASGNINLAVGSNTITVLVTAQDGTTTSTYTVTVTRAASAVATLSALSLSAGTLTPIFATGTTSYTASVANSVTSLNVTPTVTDSNASVKVNNVTVASSSASGSINLAIGSNTITVLVTAQDGTTTGSYTITVTRAASAVSTLSDLTLSSGTMSPTFATGTTGYTASVANNVTSLTATPTVSDSTATVKVNGTTVTSGSDSGSISLNVGSNTITVLVTAQDGTTTSSYTVTVTRIASAVSTLSNLVLSSGTLAPTFATGTTAYTASVANSVASLTVTPTVTDSNATVKVNGTTVTSGSASGSISLNVGSNTITVLVTAQDGTTTSTYSVTVTRAASTVSSLSALSLSSGTLTPTFTSGTTAYTASVANSVTSITATPTLTDSSATVKVNGTAVTSGSASGNINLAVGSNTITALVTAQDGTTTSTYTVTVTRAASAVATLSALSLSAGTLNPIFASGTTGYTASVANGVSSLTVTPTVTDSNASVKVNNVTVASGSASGSISLNVGSNTITVLVTAQDGTTTSSYTITVTRAASAVSTLSDLTLSSGTMSPTFATGTTGYTASVANSVTSLTATPTVSDSTATVKVNGTTVTSGSASGSISLNVGSNTITVLVTAQDGTTTSSYTVTVTRAASAVSTLSNLVLSYGTLSPTFASATTSYSASVANSVTSITATPTLSDSNATVKVNGSSVTSGSASGSINLAVGINTITVIVTAQDGITISSYTITVTRSKPAQTIGAITFTPATLTVGNSTMASATATSSLAVQFASTTPSVCTVKNSTVTAVAVGNCTITGDQPGDGSYNAATQVTNSITVAKASQTISFPGMDSPIAKTYGAPDFSISALATSNLTVVLASSSNTAVATITSGGLIHITGAGTTTITATQAGNASFNSASATITLTVAPTPLSIVADNKNRAYGATDPAFTVTYTGFVNGETSAVLGGSPAVATDATSASPTGSYDITPSQGAITNTNYSVTYTKGTLAVGLSSQKIVFNPLQSRIYGDGTFTLSATGGASGKPVTFSSSDTAVATISGSTVTIVGAGTATITASQDGDNINYAPASAQQTLTVNKASLMVTANSDQRFYGDDNPSFTVSYSGFVNNETSAAVTGTPAITTTATTASPTGSYDITPAVGTLSASNYKFTFNRGTLAVDLILQNITFAAIPAKTYGDAAFNPGATGGSSGYAITYSSSDTSVATVSGSTVTIVGAGQTLINANQAGDANYSSATATQMLKVAPAPLTVTATDKNRAYGASDPAFTVTYSGFVNNEGQGALTGAPELATTATATSNPGGYPITVAVGSLTSNNYTFSFVNGTLTVAKNTASATLDIASLSATYDGTAKAATATTVPAGLYVNMTYSDAASTEVISPTNAGTYSVTGTVSDSGYSGSASGTLTIAKANQSISGLAATVTKVYGNADFATGATATSGLAVTYQSSNVGVATVNTNGTVHIVGAGSTTITATQSGNGNYNSTSAQMSLTVNKATLTVTAGNASRLAGAANPTFSATYSGFVNGETAVVLTGTPDITTTTTASASGSYPITPAVGTLVAANYTFSFVPGTLAVGMSTQTIIFNPLNAVTYGAMPFSLTATGGASGNPVTFTSSNTAVATIDGTTVTIVGAGSTTITANQAGNSSYAPASAQQTLTVKPATLLVSANNASRNYGNANPAFTATYTGFVNSDTASVLTGALAFTTTATSTSPTGSYPITPATGTLASNNYSFIITPGTMGVNLASQNISFNPLPARTYGDPAFNPGAIGDASGNPVTYTSSDPSVATASGSTITIVGVGQTTITANQDGNSNYASATAAQILNVNQATLTVMAAGVTRPYNVSNPVLTAQYNGFAYTDTANSLSGAPELTTTAVTTSTSGSYPITITAGNLFSPNYNFTFTNGTLTVLQVTPTVTWSNPAAITYGTTLGNAQLNATASVPGSFSYAPLAGAVLNAGLSQVLNAAFTPDDTNYGGTTGSAGIDVNKAGQTIVFGASPAVVVNGTGTLIATGGGSKSAIIFTTSTSLICSVSGTTVTGIAPGACTIVANQAGDANYTDAASVSKNITIGQATATVTIGNLSQTYDGTPKYASATTTPSSLTVNLTYNGSTTAPTAAGSYTVVGTVSDDNYIGSATATLTIAKATQTVSFAAPAITTVYGNADFGPGASASTGGVVTYTSSDPAVATITSAELVHIVAAGTATITATQAGDANYLPASATQTLTVNKATLTVTASNASRAFGASDPAFSATYSGFVNGESTSAISGAPVLTSTATSTGSTGSYTITPSVGTLSAANYSFTFASGTLAVGIASQNIVFNPLAPQVYGSANFTLTATGGLSGNPIVFTSSNTAVATVSGTTATIVGAGTATITATQAGNSNYAQATAQQILTINPAPLMVTADNAQRYYGEPDPVFSVTYTGFVNSETAAVLTGTPVITTAATTASTTGSYPITPAIGTLAAANYSFIFAPATLAVDVVSQTISFSQIPAKTYGAAAFDLSATGGESGYPVTYTSANPAVATVSGSTVTITGAGQAILIANQAGDLNYASATAQQLLTVNRATLTVTAGDASRLYGSENPAFSVTYSGFVNNEDQSKLAGAPVLATTADITSPVAGYPITVASGNLFSNNYTFSFVNGALTLDKATPVITWGNPSAITYGTALDGTQLNATANVPGAFSYSPPAGTLLNGGTGQTLSVAFAPADTLNYTTATASVAINVVQAPQIITFGPPSTLLLIGGTATVSATSTSGLPVTFSSSTPAFCSVSGVTVTGITTGSCIIAANQVGNINYNPVTPVTQTIQVGKLSQSITFGALPVLKLGDADANPGASASSGLAVTYASSNQAVATVVNNKLHLVAVGNATITASQSGNGMYLAAAPVSLTLAVGYNAVPPTLFVSAISDGATTTEVTQNISGKVADINGIKSVTIRITPNGEPAGADVTVQVNPDGSFSFPVQLLTGANSITVIVTNNAGMTTTDTRTITLDPSSPKLTVTYPPDNGVSYQKPITVTGTIASLFSTGKATAKTVAAAADPTLVVSYSINGSATQSASLTDTTYSFNTTLDDGMNTIKIFAANGAGQKVEAKRTVNYELPTFSLAITDPAADAHLALNSYLLSGVVTNNTTPVTVTITMDGQSYTPVVGTNGAFSQQLSFTEDKTYQISVTGIDQNNNSQSAQRNIIHTLPKAADGTITTTPFTIVDALQALQMTARIITPTSSQLIRMDVAPMVKGISMGDGKIDIEDVLIILYMAVGLIH